MIYTLGSGPMPTTASFAFLSTGTAIKTMLQAKLIIPGKIIEWGCSFDQSAAATPGLIELCSTAAINATVTASVAADCFATDAQAREFNAAGSIFTLATSGTGYNASAEGSVAAVTEYDFQQVDPAFQFVKQFPLGQEPQLKAADIIRIRMKFAAAVNAYAYMKIAIGS